jgi:3-methyladenine DNA glycosylase AlkD
MSVQPRFDAALGRYTDQNGVPFVGANPALAKPDELAKARYGGKVHADVFRLWDEAERAAYERVETLVLDRRALRVKAVRDAYVPEERSWVVFVEWIELEVRLPGAPGGADHARLS